MGEPRIIAEGRTLIPGYKKEDLRDILRCKFHATGKKYFVLDEYIQAQRYMAAAAAWGIDQGLLRYVGPIGDGPQRMFSLHLTDKGQLELLD